MILLLFHIRSTKLSRFHDDLRTPTEVKLKDNSFTEKTKKKDDKNWKHERRGVERVGPNKGEIH